MISSVSFPASSTLPYGPFSCFCSILSSTPSAEHTISSPSKVFIKGLPLSTSEGRLVKAFSEFGEVSQVKLIMDKESGDFLGFAYIWFAKEESAQLAVKEMNGKNIEHGAAGSVPFGSFWWFIYAGFSSFLVLFAGIMSGLTLGLMSLSVVDLEILQRSGTPAEKLQAGLSPFLLISVPFSASSNFFFFFLDGQISNAYMFSVFNSPSWLCLASILPVVQKQHQLLVTLLLCNACAMEALPIYLDRIFNEYLAIILSVTFVLFFGEVIPQAICSRYGLAVGANVIWLVRLLMIICYPIAYPIGKMLDWVLGHNQALFRRAQLKALVSIHSQEAGKGGELTHDETTIISGALDLTEKTAQEAMTPIESTFSLDVNSKLDWEAMGKVLARGHSRVPVYSGHPKNIIGLLLVKSLLTVRPETETPLSAVSIRRVPRVPADMPLYDILNEFQKGSSHMAAVVKAKGKGKTTQVLVEGQKDENRSSGDSGLTTPLLQEQKSESVIVDVDMHSNAPTIENGLFLDDIEDGEVIGIITLEDVFEELLQEEIVDETDEYVDVHKRIRVAAAAAASSVARCPSIRRLTVQKGAGGQTKQGQAPRKSTEVDGYVTRLQGNSVEPIGNWR
ncbi:DUF21 domain-containing protein [Senna tora]|uniref:DUF21 domain-containing protein n=1 Tax=Senna tora TaxID=362788 RepID=A0A834T2C6_9FABA|nr:DUF21 domain-containing protein [Senna tora]